MPSLSQEAILVAASAPHTDRYGVTGNPITHSKSPIIHVAFAQQAGQRIRYDRICAELIVFDEAVMTFMREGGRELNMAVPFKLDTHAMSMPLPLRAESADVVSTLKFSGDEIFDDNTDDVGLVRDITHNIGNALGDERAPLLGADDAVRGVLLPPLEHKSARVFPADRIADRANRLIEYLGVSAKLHEIELVDGDYDELAAGDMLGVIISTTVSSLQAEAPPVPTTMFGPNALTYDMTYGLRSTVFAEFVQRNGAHAWDSLGTLMEQVAESFFVWCGVRSDTTPALLAMREGLRGEAAVAARVSRWTWNAALR